MPPPTGSWWFCFSDPNHQNWTRAHRGLMGTFGEYQMLAQLIATRWLVLPWIHKDVRAYHPPLAQSHSASVTLNHQKCARARKL
jgi:hypothetical protein